jgi:NAD(P)-dependent dehydrogenase (short-subunit alcohol dehydrogenase family)
MNSVLLIAHGDDEVATAVTHLLKGEGWEVLVDSDSGQALSGVVYLPGLLDGYVPVADPAAGFIELMEVLAPRLASARVVAVSSRDWLGWGDRPRVAAAAAGLVAAVRSLALAHGRAGVTVNAVIGMSSSDGPTPLTPAPVSAEDIAAAVGFLLDPRSAYITGQVLHCCGGANLLSSMSS